MWKRFRRLLIGTTVVLAVIAAYLTVNALRLQSRQMQVHPAALVAVDADQLSAIMVEFLATPSFSHADRSLIAAEPFLRLHEILEQRFPNASEVMQRRKFNELSLVYHWAGTDPTAEPILLMSHLDVVPIEHDSKDQWTVPADQPKTVDGYIWGRGALDVKCGVIGIMAAIEQLARDGFQPRHDIYLAFGHDEEIGGSEGNGAIAAFFIEQGTRFRFVLDEGGAILQDVIPGIERPVAFVAIAEKRYAQFTLHAKGAGGHGSMPGRSAVVNLAQAVINIDAHPMPSRLPDSTALLFDYLAPEMPLLQRTVIANRNWFEPLLIQQLVSKPSTAGVVRSTINVTHVATSTAANQNATSASATINARLLPGDTPEAIMKHIRQITADIHLENGEPAIDCSMDRLSSGEQVAPIDCDEFRLLQHTIHETFPEVIVAPGLTAVSTDSAKYFPVTDKVYRFIPTRLNQVDLARIHGVDERIAVANLAEIAQFYMQLIRNASANRSY